MHGPLSSVPTLCRLKEAGAKRIFAIITHGILSGPAIERIQESDLEILVSSNTVPLQDKIELCPKLRVCAITKYIQLLFF